MAALQALAAPVAMSRDEIRAVYRDDPDWEGILETGDIMRPCLGCGRSRLPEDMDYTTCPVCHAVHGICPHCGDDVLADDDCPCEADDDTDGGAAQ